jgi:putative (di)nucleoside polyphosphate hydrolase
MDRIDENGFRANVGIILMDDAGQVLIAGRRGRSGGVTREWIRYRLPRKYVRKQGPLCIGQKQRWFLLMLQAAPAKLCFDSTDAPEFDRCRWVDYWKPVEEVIYFKRKVYIRALTELSRIAFVDSSPPPMPSDWPASWLKA